MMELLLEGTSMQEQTTQAHIDHWGMGGAERWDVDQEVGEIVFTFPDKVVTAPVQMIGSYSQAGRTWMAAWANPAVPDRISVASEEVRAYGEEHDIPILTMAQLDADAEAAETIAAIACRITRSAGIYRAADLPIVPYLFFGPTVTITPNGGPPTTFTIDTDG